MLYCLYPRAKLVLAGFMCLNTLQEQYKLTLGYSSGHKNIIIVFTDAIFCPGVQSERLLGES